MSPKLSFIENFDSKKNLSNDENFDSKNHITNDYKEKNYCSSFNLLPEESKDLDDF